MPMAGRDVTLAAAAPGQGWPTTVTAMSHGGDAAAAVGRILGYTEEEFVGRHLACNFPPEDVARGDLVDRKSVV